jgi:membrane protease YdiL (CAAX protease family)
MLVIGALAMGGYAGVMVARDARLGSDPQRLSELLEQAATVPWFLVASSAFSSIVLSGAALVGARLSRERVRARLRTGPSNISGLRLLVAVAGFVALGEASSAFVAWAHVPLSGSLARMSKATESASGASLVGVVLSIGLLAGLAEELFFRGFMQARLARRWGSWPAVFAAATAFGISHLNLVHSASAFVMGLYAGWLLERTGSIRAGAVGHIANNIAWVLLSAAFPGGVENLIGASRCLIVALVVLGTCVAVIRTDPGI